MFFEIKLSFFSCLRWEPSKKDSGKAKIPVAQLREVRSGKNTEMFHTSDIAEHFPDEFSFSIIYNEGKTLDLIANSADEANIWITGVCVCVCVCVCVKKIGTR